MPEPTPTRPLERKDKSEKSTPHEFPEIDFDARTDMVVEVENRKNPNNNPSFEATHRVAYLKSEVERAKGSGEYPRSMPLSGEISQKGTVLERYKEHHVECPDGRIICTGIDMEFPQQDGTVIHESFTRELNEKGQRMREVDTVGGRVRQESRIVSDPNTGEVVKWEYTEYDDSGTVVRTNIQERNPDGTVSYRIAALNEIERQGTVGRHANGQSPEIHPWVLGSTHEALDNLRRSFS